MNDHIYLAHHGIKGQKWGVRRFRNKDGTLTAEGKKHYGTSHPMTKNQAKMAILKSKVLLRRKATRNVDKAVDTAVRSDKEAQRLKAESEKARSQSDMAFDAARYKETRYQALNDETDSSSSYFKRLKTSVAKDEADNAWRRYDQLEAAAIASEKAYVKRRNKVGSAYYEQYKRAAVKDMGIEDIDAGVRMLEAYGIVDVALGYRHDRYKGE